MTYPILQQAYGLLYSLEMLHLEKFALTAMTFKVTSGVFMISARRGEATVRVEWVLYHTHSEWVWCSTGSWAPPRKKSILTKHDKFGCIIFDAVFNRQKTRVVTRSLGKRILRFNHETKLTKQCNNYPNVHGQTQRGRTIASPEYATEGHSMSSITVLFDRSHSVVTLDSC